MAVDSYFSLITIYLSLVVVVVAVIIIIIIIIVIIIIIIIKLAWLRCQHIIMIKDLLCHFCVNVSQNYLIQQHDTSVYAGPLNVCESTCVQAH